MFFKLKLNFLTLRKEKGKRNSDLYGTKYLLLKNDENLTEKQRLWKMVFMGPLMHVKTAIAYAMRVKLQDICEECFERNAAEARIKKLCSWIMHSRVEEMKCFCRIIRNHWGDIMNYFNNPYTNAVLGRIDSII